MKDRTAGRIGMAIRIGRAWGVAAVALAAAVLPGHAQTLLKPGQGLVGAPQPIEPEAPPPKPQTTADGVTKLPEVDVDGKRDPLSESDRRLGKQKKALPGLGSDGKRTPGTGEKVIDAYNKLEKDPNKLDRDSKDFIEHQLRAPDVNHHEATAPVIDREAQDYADPIAAQQAAPAKKK